MLQALAGLQLLIIGVPECAATAGAGARPIQSLLHALGLRRLTGR